MNLYFKRKSIRILRLSALCLLLGLEAGFATETYSQKTLFTLSVENQSVKEVFDYIEQNSEFIIFYLDKTVDLNRKVSIQLKDQQVESILNQLFENTDNTYTINDRQIIISKRKEVMPEVPESKEVTQQKKVVTGTVVDALGPVAGANIIVKGTANGTMTDMDGKFSLEVPEDATLEISYIGYVTQQIKVGSQTTLNITLKEDTQALDEVIVIGYGIQKKSVVTGAISSVKAEDIMNTANTRPEQALQGKTSGVQVLSSSGAPGSAMKIRIRGYSSNGNSEPLYIVDGLRTTDISNLEPSNIASMEVLKDGASAAIYGAEGGNGVVLITTKSGKTGKAQVTYDFQYTLQSLGKSAELMDAYQYLGYMSESGALTGVNYEGIDTDWIKESFETSPMQKHNISISGGSDKTTYFASLSYLNQKGIVKGDYDSFKRYSGMFNGSHQINKWLKVGSSIQLNWSSRKSFNENDEYRGVIANAALLDPLTPVEYTGAIPTHVQSLIDAGQKLIKSEDGNYYGISPYVTGEAINPFVQAYQSQTTTTRTGFMGNVYADITPLEGLTFTTKFAVNYYSQNRHNYRP